MHLLKAGIGPVKVILLAVSCLALTACPDKNKNKSKPGVVREQVVLGDPIEAIRGAYLKPQGAFEAFEGLQSVHVFATYEFLEKDDAADLSKELTQDDLEKEEAATEKYEVPESIELVIEKKNANTLVLYNTAEKTKFTLEKNSSDNITYTLIDEDGIETGSLLHFSQHKDGNIFSFLTYGSSQRGKSLTGIYFAKKFNPQIPPKASKPYNYLEGPGYKVKWKQKQITIDLCGKQEEFVQDHSAYAVNEWNATLGLKLKIEYRESESFYPFTDLNQHCIYIVDNLRFEPDPRSATYGGTAEIRNYENSSFIDADILIFKKEFEKHVGHNFDDDFHFNTMRATFVHEIGHFLGLDHIFDENIKSIMGYDFSISPKLQPIDKEAIQALYE